MKEYFRFFAKALPLTIGVALTLTGLCFLVDFYDRGLYFTYEEFWAFCFYFVIGFPTLFWGVNHLAGYTPNKSNQSDA